MTLLFNTSFHISSSMESEFKRWAQDEYLPAVDRSGLFKAPTILKVLTARDSEEGETFCIQMFSSKPREAMKWLDEEAPKVRNSLINRYDAERVLHFTSSMLVVGEKED